MQRLIRHLSISFRRLLPGIFLVGFCIGTGSITAMSKAGADYGMSLLWTLVCSCVITGYLIMKYGELTLITGETALNAISKHLHVAIAYYFILALGLNVAGSIMGVMGIVSEICSVWTESLMDARVPSIVFAAAFTVLSYLLFLTGRLGVFEKALAAMVAVMAVAFLVNLSFAMPDWKQIVRGLIPELVPAEGGRPGTSLLVIASMVGTTVFSGLFIVRGIQVKHSMNFEDSRAGNRNDAIFSAFLMFLISATVMASAAATLHPQGIVLTDTAQLVTLLEPLLGPLSVSLITLGVIAAGLSSQFPNLTLVPMLVYDLKGRPVDFRKRMVRTGGLLFALLGLFVPLFGFRPVSVMVASQAFGALLLPVTVACLIALGNNRELMGNDHYRFRTNLLLATIFGFSLMIMFVSLIGLKAYLFG